MSKKIGRFGKAFRVQGSDRNGSSQREARAVARNVAQIAKMEEARVRARTLPQRVAHVVTLAAGTATFAMAHLVWFGVWIAINTGWVRRVRPFDPYPFSLLTMITSLEAIFLSIWILISQNEMTGQADRRAHLDLQVNLLAEQESTATLRLVKQIAERMGIQVSDTVRTLAAETDLDHVASAIDEALPDSAAPSSDSPPPSLRS
jgi:uncharacterized membrane protein